MATTESDYYKAASDMLRHYSAVRATIMGLTLPICFGLLGLAYSGRAAEISKMGLVMIELCVFVFAIVLSIHFSDRYEETKSYLIDLENGNVNPFYSVVIIKRPGLMRRVRSLDGINRGLIIIGLFLHFVFLVKEVLPGLIK